MRIALFICIVATVQIITGCDRKEKAEEDKVEVKKITISEEEDQVPPPAPPPPDVKSKPPRFKSLQEWLIHICNTGKPKKPIEIFKLGLFEGGNENTVFLVGTKSYTIDQYNSATRIEFEPDELYYTLPHAEYKNLKREEVVAKLTSQLKEFTKTAVFKNSFLAEAKSITTEFNGEIWHR